MCSYGKNHLQIDHKSDNLHNQIIKLLKGSGKYDPIRWHQESDAHIDDDEWNSSRFPPSASDKLLCADCWINLLPYIPEYLTFIHKYLSEHCRCVQDSKMYIESLEGYVYSKFICFLMCESLTIKFILSHSELSCLLFDICVRLFNILYIDNN